MKRLAITPLGGPVTATAIIPGSKSYTNRALLVAALTQGPVTLVNALISDDTRAMVACLQQLGIQTTVKARRIDVLGDYRDVKNQDYDLDAGLSGTTMRFMIALSAVLPGRQTLRGKTGLQKRPIGHLVTALQQLGADIEYLDVIGYPPLRVITSSLSGTNVTIDGRESSQYLSALLMIAPLIGKLSVKVEGELSSKPFVLMTVDLMKQFGVLVEDKDNSYQIASGQLYDNSEYLVEGDVSSASYFAAIAALTGSTITLKNLNPDSKQADMGFFKILEQMGNVVTYGPLDITVTGKGVQPVDVNMQDCPDQAQTLAVLAAFAKGKTIISGIRSLRIKETERIKALQNELQKMAIQTSATHDTLIIHGGQPEAASIATYGDHRMAMAFAVAGSSLPGMDIQDPDVVTKTFPDFWQQLASIGVKIHALQPNIVLIGMRGSGKTTVAAELAKRLGRELHDVDSMISENSGKSIVQIIENHGWDYFRDQESAVARELSHHNNKVISTGGGIALRPENVTALKHSGVVILLQASAGVLANRLSGSHARPALTKAKTLHSEVRQVLKQRQASYETTADIIIDTDDLQPSQVVDQIVLELKERGL